MDDRKNKKVAGRQGGRGAGRWVRRAALRVAVSRLVTFGIRAKMPERNIALAYLFYMVAGFLLLLLPWSHGAQSVSVVDHLFTAVSAVSTTGLATVDVPEVYSTFGMCVILLLIQLGGIGYMTVSSYLMLHLTHRMSRRNIGVISTSVPVPQGMSLTSLVNNVVNFTILFELIGFADLWVTFGILDVESPAWNALFISISSFCTAGFSPFSDSLCSFSANWAVNLIVAFLSFAGAMGFIVITDMMRKLRNRRARITFTTRVIVVISFVLTALGTLFMVVEPGAAQSHSPLTKFLEAFFQTMSAMTTVGYNTFDLSTLPLASVLLLSVVMFIGASPSGTGGGVKCTTVSAAYAFVLSRLRGRGEVTLRGNRLPFYRVNSALTNILFYGTVLLIGVLLLSITEKFPLSSLIFEAASALGTVGLSLNVTPGLTVFGKLTVIALMYIGRLGVLTFGAAVLARTMAAPETPSRRGDIAV